MSTVLDAAVAATPVRRATNTAVDQPIPITRVLGIEFRKMFNTRSGFWLMASIVITSLIATGAVIIFAPDSALTYETFATAIGMPIAIILPIVAILSVTSEWSQRSALTTFTLVPSRSRVITAKAICAITVGVVSMLAAIVIGALGNVVGTAIAGVDPVWDADLRGIMLIVLSNVFGLLIGFMLGVLTRNSAVAICAYFVYSFLVPTLSSALAAYQEWWRDLGPWLDFGYASSRLYDGPMTGEHWLQIATSGTLWLLLPLAIGLRLVMRSEVK